MKKLYSILAMVLVSICSLQAQIIINEVLYDPSNTGLEGDANGDGSYSQGEDEFIEFVNIGKSNVDVGGYEIWDDTTSGSLVYTIPSNTVIPPSGALVIFGGGTPTGTFGGAIVLADTGSGLSFNNSGEVIIIKDNNGTPILSFDSDALSNNPDESYTRYPDFTGSFEQHGTNTSLLFSPGTTIDGSPFNSSLAKDITFTVDMTNYSGSFTSVNVFGNFNNWCDTCDALTDVNSNNIWEVTTPITRDSIEYKFILDKGASEETFTGGESCTKTTGAFTNRFAYTSTTTTLPVVCYASCAPCATEMHLKGIIDFTVPEGGSSGKAVHVIADSNIPNLSIYGIGVANNGGGTDGQEYTFPAISAQSGDHILVVRDSAAMAAYFGMCFSEFDIVLTDNDGNISQNGDDAIELFRANGVVETFGDINVDGTGEDWEYGDSWAYKLADGTWTYGGVDCTDGSTTTYDSDCRYPACPPVLVSTITVMGEGGASTITTPAGTLQMMATVDPSTADDTTITWSVNDMSIATIDTMGLLTAAGNGTVTVTATANDGSGVTGTADITISNQGSGINQLLNFISVYPNPAKSELNLVSEKEIKTFKIYNIQGAVVLKGDKLVNQTIDISALNAGTYLLQADFGDSQGRTTFIKNN